MVLLANFGHQVSKSWLRPRYEIDIQYRMRIIKRERGGGGKEMQEK